MFAGQLNLVIPNTNVFNSRSRSSPMPPTLRRTVLGAAALVFCLGLVWTVRAQEKHTYNVTLSLAEATTDPAGRVVVTMLAKGDLAGVVTLALEKNAAGTVTGGEWALNVSYVESVPVDPNAPVNPSGDNDGGERLVQKGMIKGRITSGTLTLNADGTLSSLDGVLLSLDSGTLQYQSATSGSGLVTASQLGNRDTATGAVSFIF
jgi:hypothetical protein